MKKPLLIAAGVLLAAFLAYLLAWPTGMQPVAWTPPPAPPLTGTYATNEALKGIERLAEGVGRGPEGVVVDDTGTLYTGFNDGRLVAVTHDGLVSELANTGGRPLGVALAPNGGLFVADAKKGLLHVNGGVTELATAADGVPFGFTDDLDVARASPKVYFTDASSRFGYGKHMTDILEHGANGRLLEYDFVTQELRVLMSGLAFANGVAVGPDDAYVLVNETSKYRVLRYWLKGEQAGKSDVFIDNLPGFPDNITFNGRDRFWVAIFAPRDALLDSLLPGNAYLRTVIAKLPRFLQPRPKLQSFALGLGLDGRVAVNLQYIGDDAYAPITSVREHGGYLYFGSLTYPAVGRIRLEQALSPF